MDVTSICEVRRTGEALMELNSGHLLFYKGRIIEDQSGVGILLSKSEKRSIEKFIA